MPIHQHQCEHCDRIEYATNTIREAPVWPMCCGDIMPRTHFRAHSTGAYDKPIEMMSLAVNTPEQLDEFRQRNPTAEISDDPNNPLYGVPIARTRQEKLRILRNEGFVEKN